MKISLLLAFLSGILYVLSFAPWDQSYLAWVALIPLFFAVDSLPKNRDQKRIQIGLGLIVSFLICMGGFYWIVYATQEYGGLPLIAALFLFLAFCFTGQLQVPLFLLMRRRLAQHSWYASKPFLRALTYGIFYAGIEALIPKIFSDTAGNAFSHSPWLRQPADIGGPFFLTLLIVMTNELLYTSIRLKNVRAGVYGLLIPLSVLVYGSFRVGQFESLKTAHAADPTFKAALIQANIGDYLKVAAERGVQTATNQVMSEYLDLSRSALKDEANPDAIVWPETAYPAIFNRPLSPIEMQMESSMLSFSESMKPLFIFGGYDMDLRGQEYNSIYFYEPSLKKKEIYHKSVLLMFGETLPFADTFTSMKEWFPNMGFFGRGPGPSVVSVKNLKGEAFKLAPSICYEGLFTDFSVEGAKLGADALLNVTNDSWFGPNGEPDLHLALTNFRSIETRLPMLRATNTGYSVWINELGGFEKITKQGAPGILQTSITHRIMSETPYMTVSRVFGNNWFIRLIESLTLGTLLFLFIKRKQLNAV